MDTSDALRRAIATAMGLIDAAERTVDALDRARDEGTEIPAPAPAPAPTPARGLSGSWESFERVRISIGDKTRDHLACVPPSTQEAIRAVVSTLSAKLTGLSPAEKDRLIYYDPDSMRLAVLLKEVQAARARRRQVGNAPGPGRTRPARDIEKV